MTTYSSSFPPNWGLAVLCWRFCVTSSAGTSSRLSISVIFQRCIYESWLFSLKKVAFQWTLEYFTVAVYADWKCQCRLLQDAAEAEEDAKKRGGGLLCPFCGHSSPSPSLFGPCLSWPRSPISATAELLLKFGIRQMNIGRWCVAVDQCYAPSASVRLSFSKS